MDKSETLKARDLDEGLVQLQVYRSYKPDDYTGYEIVYVNHYAQIVLVRHAELEELTFEQFDRRKFFTDDTI